MKRKVKTGIIGLGGRGRGLLDGVILQMKEVEVAAVCDLYEDRCQQAADQVEAVSGKRPFASLNYREVLQRKDVDAVVVSTSWQDHIQIAIDAMRAGKYAGVEVGGAFSVQQCWDLVHAYEETGVPCMLLENCCYGEYEMMVLNMVRQGLFGQIVHCEGGYCHDLRSEVAFGRENRHYRLKNYLNRSCENYPTHELGPIAKVLGINRGNRMLTLGAVASKSAGMHTFLKKERGDEYDLTHAAFQQADVVTTTIACAQGETICLTLNTTLPRPYSRKFAVYGTKACYQEDNNSLFLDGVHNNAEFEFNWKPQWGNAEPYLEEYRHPLWQEYRKGGLVGGHGGMDGLVLGAFFDSVRQGNQTPIDVYDMAAWMVISALSEESIALGGHPVAIPDFTNGRWFNREAPAQGKYALDDK